ncbi:MAG: tyrosine--tRNA ligase [Candidatus Micrarchaeia archaeon]
MDLETRLELVSRPPAQELVTREETRTLLESERAPVHYIGFEISGLLHVGSLLVSSYKINDLHEAGFNTAVFLADWHSIINNKLGGDWDAILEAAKYYEEAFKFACPGVRIVRGSELYHDNDDYWRDVIRFSKHVTIARATRCMQALGRSESEALDVAQYVYPSMQAVDIKHLGADLAHAGMDQRKAHMLARDTYPKMGWKPPVALHHELLPSLLKPVEGEAGKMDSKMSKSKPDSGVFIHDSPEEIKRKLNKAYCPAQSEGNPVLALARVVCFRNGAVRVERPEKFGGNVEYDNYQKIEADYLSGKLHAADLKAAVTAGLDAAVAPVRKHFEKHAKLLEVYSKTSVTR